MSPSSSSTGVMPASCASSAWADRCRHSPCTGTATGGFTSRYSRRSSSRAGWPETWIMWSCVGHQPHAAAHQIVLHRADGALVAGNDAAGEHHRVALAQLDARVLVERDARQRRARLALAAGDQDQQIVVGDVVRLVLADEGRDAGEVAAFARGGVDVAQRAADQRHRAAGVAGGERHRFHAGRRCWRSRSPPPARAASGPARTASAAHRLPSRNVPPPWRWWSRRSSPAPPPRPAWPAPPRPMRGPISGSGSSFQSPVCNTVPAGVRMTSACASGMECVMRMNCSENGGSSKLPPGGTTRTGTSVSNCASPSLRRSTAAANGVA